MERQQGAQDTELARRYLEQWATAVEQALDGFLPGEGEPPAPVLHRAMRYATLGGGKRLRAALALAACEAVGAGARRAMPVACAVELLHAYSLIHDDLPAMDDDDWRRGKPACHRAFGEGLAILAGDALQSLAFELLARLPELVGVAAATALAVAEELGRAVGSRGMAGGQALDLLSEGTPPEPATVQTIHAGKTAALMAAAVVAGALVGIDRGKAALEDPRLHVLRRFGQLLGMAFQGADDLLDELADPAATGKGVGRDRRRGKATLPAAVGLQQARRQVLAWAEQAESALQELEEGPARAVLAQLARLVVARVPVV
ncbi:MAG TPA: farnesyl diphosphate synthase [Limnochordales bacterium]